MKPIGHIVSYFLTRVRSMAIERVARCETGNSKRNFDILNRTEKIRDLKKKGLIPPCNCAYASQIMKHLI